MDAQISRKYKNGCRWWRLISQKLCTRICWNCLIMSPSSICIFPWYNLENGFMVFKLWQKQISNLCIFVSCSKTKPSCSILGHQGKWVVEAWEWWVDGGNKWGWWISMVLILLEHKFDFLWLVFWSTFLLVDSLFLLLAEVRENLHSSERDTWSKYFLFFSLFFYSRSTIHVNQVFN